MFFFFFQAEDGIRDDLVTGVQTCALPICTLAGRFPENRILSHDLLESVYARCGLVSDVTLYEEYPSRYEIDAVRRHRWIRGDWQILPWLLPRVPDAEGRGIRNPISAVSWWKIFENLRRSLVPIALVLF